MSELSLPLPDALRPATLCSDAQLVRRAARGDQRAFGEIFERHHQAVYRYCRAILRNEEDAADALQNTMAAVLRGLDGEAREIALKPWLFRIAHNESLSLIRRRRPETELDEDSPVAAAGGPEVQALASERLRQLVEDLQALPDRQRGALVMRELSGLEYAQIAAAFGVAEGAARQAVYEAREMLHEIGEGRAMACAEVRELISARDGRLLRGRKVRAHLRACAGCEEFRAAIGQRGAALAAVAPPLPAVMAASIFQGLLGGGGQGGAGVAVGGASATIASATAGSATTAKSLAGVGVLAKGSATAGIATKAAAVLAAGATLTGGGVIAKQQLQRDAGHSPAAAASRSASDLRPGRPATATPTATREDADDQARAAQREAAERGPDDAVRSTAVSAVAAREEIMQRRAAASQRAATQTPTTARRTDARAGRSAAGTRPAASTSATAPAQRPASAQTPGQATAAAPVTAPAPVATVRPPSTPTAPASADSAPAAPSVSDTPEAAPPAISGR